MIDACFLKQLVKHCSKSWTRPDMAPSGGLEVGPRPNGRYATDGRQQQVSSLTENVRQMRTKSWEWRVGVNTTDTVPTVWWNPLHYILNRCGCSYLLTQLKETAHAPAVKLLSPPLTFTLLSSREAWTRRSVTSSSASLFYTDAFPSCIGATAQCDPWDAYLQLWRLWGPSIFVGLLQLLYIVYLA